MSVTHSPFGLSAAKWCLPLVQAGVLGRFGDLAHVRSVPALPPQRADDQPMLPHDLVHGQTSAAVPSRLSNSATVRIFFSSVFGQVLVSEMSKCFFRMRPRKFSDMVTPTSWSFLASGDAGQGMRPTRTVRVP